MFPFVFVDFHTKFFYNEERLCSRGTLSAGHFVKGVIMENKREKLVALSEDGKEIYEKFNKWSEEWKELCFKDFNKDEISTFMGLLDKMIKNLE